MIPLPRVKGVEAALQVILVDLRIDLRCPDRLVPEDDLNVPHVASGAQQVRAE